MYKDISTGQDKMLKQVKFNESLHVKVDMNKIELDTIKPWIRKRITELLGKEDDAVIKFVINQLEADTFPDPRRIQINLTSILKEENACIFMMELWQLLCSAQDSSTVIPPKFKSTNLYSLHDPNDINHIHGLRNRLFITFNEFANILKNVLTPPVIQIQKRKLIKLTESEELANYNNNIVDLVSLIYEIRKESKNKCLHDKSNKTNAMLRKCFQMKLIQCYKLIINVIKLCSKTLEGKIYNPIQSKMINLIQITSSLSLITGKYLYGESFKKKKTESFDLVQYCKDLKNILVDSGYSDDVSEQPKKTLVSSKKKDVAEKQNKCKMTNNKSIIKKEEDIETAIQKYAPLHNDSDDTEEQFKISELTKNEEKYSTMQLLNKKEANINSENTLRILKKDKLKTINNVGTFHVIFKENIWRNFPIKNINISENGKILLSLSQKSIDELCLYRRQFQQSRITSVNQLATIFNITELISEDLIKEVVSKTDNSLLSMIHNLIKMELEE